MITMQPVVLDDVIVIATTVQLPNTTLLILQTDGGYVMCGALDIDLLRNQLSDRKIIAARAVGVRTIEELLNGEIESCTQAAEILGINEGMAVREALRIMNREACTVPSSV